MNRTHRLVAVAAASLALLTSACGALDEGGGSGAEEAPDDATTVRIGYLHTIAVDDKLWLGQVEGQWADAGLDIKATAFDTGELF